MKLILSETRNQLIGMLHNQWEQQLQQIYPARALRALGLLLADIAPIVGGGKTF